MYTFNNGKKVPVEGYFSKKKVRSVKSSSAPASDYSDKTENFLCNKFLGLPTWAWIIIVAICVFMAYSCNKNSKSKSKKVSFGFGF